LNVEEYRGVSISQIIVDRQPALAPALFNTSMAVADIAPWHIGNKWQHYHLVTGIYCNLSQAVRSSALRFINNL
jgi:hypothetical protein